MTLQITAFPALSTDLTPFWVGDTASQWDTLKLKYYNDTGDSIVVPGVCQLSPRYKFDVIKNKAQGQNAATVTNRGLEAREIVATIKIWDEEDFLIFQYAIIPALGGSSPYPKYTALVLTHPVAQLMQLLPCTVGSIDISAPNAKTGMVIKVLFIENAPPQPVVVNTNLTPLKTQNLNLPGQTPNGIATP